jgi:RimJ/RimL family protein N-acetyltransferase
VDTLSFMPTELPRFQLPADPRPDDVPWPEMTWPPAPDTVLSGSTVTLRPYAPDDAPELFRSLDDARVWENLGARPGSAEQLAERIATHERDRVSWVVRLLTTVGDLNPGSIVGITAFLDVSTYDARLEIGATSYTPAVWATCVNPETKLLLLAYAFEVLGVGRVQLKTDVRNTRSQQAIARLGATYEGTLRRYQRRADATIWDTVLFSLTAEDWPECRQRLKQRLWAGHGEASSQGAL